VLCSDASFDQFLPKWAQKVSEVHWSPVAVAIRAAQLLVRDRESRILDVGSGIGKFCHVGCLTSEARFVGVEERGALVRTARAIAQRLDLARTSFVHGDALAMDWNGFDGIYFFNPFLENIATFTDRLPGEVFRSSDRYVAEVEATCLKLHGLAPGVRVATYHGYGGPMPRGYDRIHAEELGTDVLEIWEKHG
jgi:SAM-dependent methyltransferase